MTSHANQNKLTQILFDRDNHVVSTNRRVSALCSSVSEGTSKLTNKICHLYKSNMKKGVNHVLISPHILIRELDRSIDSVQRYLKEAADKGLILLEKVRNYLHKVRYKITPTKKLLEIMNLVDCVDQNTDKSVPNFYTQNPHFAEKNPQNAETKILCEPQKRSHDRPDFDPLYLSIAKNTGLNYSARETLQPVVEECKQPSEPVSTIVESVPADLTTSAPKAHQGDVIEDLESNQNREAEPNAVVVEQEPVSEQTPETKNLSEVIDPEPQTLTEPNLTVDEFVDKAYEIVQEIIGLKLDHPLSINMEIFTRTIKKRMGTHFGLGSLGLSRFSDYCKTFADTPFLMGQKAMSRGNSFVSGIGTILSEKMIERFWDKSKFWQTWPPKKPTPEELQAAEDARQLEASERQALSLEEALTTAQDSVDKEVKQKLYQALGAMTYKAWIVATGFVARGIENGEPIFDIKSAFARDYLWTHHEQQLRSAFACGMGRN